MFLLIFSISLTLVYKYPSGFIVPAVATVALGSTDPSRPLTAYIFLVIAIGMSAAGKCGFFVNQLDIAPNHAGTLMGIVNGISNCFGVFSTLTCQFVVTNEVSKSLEKYFLFLFHIISILDT